MDIELADHLSDIINCLANLTAAIEEPGTENSNVAIEAAKKNLKSIHDRIASKEANTRH